MCLSLTGGHFCSTTDRSKPLVIEEAVNAELDSLHIERKLGSSDLPG
jgi:hypothetical protein